MVYVLLIAVERSETTLYYCIMYRLEYIMRCNLNPDIDNVYLCMHTGRLFLKMSECPLGLFLITLERNLFSKRRMCEKLIINIKIFLSRLSYQWIMVSGKNKTIFENRFWVVEKSVWNWVISGTDFGYWPWWAALLSYIIVNYIVLRPQNRWKTDFLRLSSSISERF